MALRETTAGGQAVYRPPRAVRRVDVATDFRSRMKSASNLLTKSLSGFGAWLDFRHEPGFEQLDVSAACVAMGHDEIVPFREGYLMTRHSPNRGVRTKRSDEARVRSGEPAPGACGRKSLGTVLDDELRSRRRAFEPVPVPPPRKITAPRPSRYDRHRVQGPRDVLAIDPPQERGRARQDQRFLKEKRGLQAWPQAHAVPDTTVELVSGEIDRARCRGNGQLQMRMSRLKSREARQQPARRERRDSREPDRTAIDSQCFDGRLYAQDRVAQSPQKGLSVVRCLYMPALSLQQARADQLLKVTDQMRYR